MIDRFRLIRPCVGLGIMFALVGCGLDAKPPTGPVAMENAAALKASPYAVYLKVSITTETEASMLYVVEREGTLSWGGGMDALVDKTTWTGTMSDDERKNLFDLLENYQWFTRDPVSTDEPKERRMRVEVRGIPGSNHFKIRGANSEVQPVIDYLDTLSRRRLEPQLQALPQPGLQKK